jgi:hypothetical protein
MTQVPARTKLSWRSLFVRRLRLGVLLFLLNLWIERHHLTYGVVLLTAGSYLVVLPLLMATDMWGLARLMSADGRKRSETDSEELKSRT